MIRPARPTLSEVPLADLSFIRDLAASSIEHATLEPAATPSLPGSAAQAAVASPIGGSLMRPYDPGSPLIFLHVPKTAGTSLREIFRGWFGPGLLEHYAGVHDGSLPVRHDLSALISAGRPLAIYGHFNRRRGFGVDDYYPEVRQFVTVLRDPFERTVSGYCHLVRQHQADPTRPAPSEGLRDYLRKKRDGAIGFFPGFITADNYEQMIDRYFVAIGVVERLEASLQRIASALGRSVDSAGLPRLNVNAEPVEEMGDLREEFIANHPLDYQMYHYAWERSSTFDAPRPNGSASSYTTQT